MTEQPCLCLTEPQPFDKYEAVRFVGIDPTHGRFGEVNIKRCTACGQLWLHYFVAYEAFTGSGRYFMGVISSAEAETISADDAVEYLNTLAWHLYAGSFFFGKKGRQTGHVNVDG